MARAPKTQTPGTALVNWEEQLAQYAEAASAQEANTGGGNFFSIKGGILTFNGAPIPGNEMAVVIADGIIENVFYEGDYDPTTPQAPTCYAFGRDEDDMTPHENVVKAGNQQNDACKGCQWNEWGSAEKGKGKACRNARRLALLSAGIFDKTGKFVPNDEDGHFEKTQLAFLKIPVTSVKGYGAFVKAVAATLKRPPFAIFTRVSVVPDAKSQFRVLFEPLATVPNGLMSTLMKRHEEAKAIIDFPYPDKEDEPPPPAKPARGAKAAPARKKY